MLRALRFVSCYLRDPVRHVVEEETRVSVGAEAVPALLFRPEGAGRGRGWVVLHGITVPGMRHPVLLRFARSLAGAGGVVLIPEVAAWKELRVDPRAAEHVIGASARHLAARDEVLPGGVGVVGFSFGATQALVTAAHPELGGAIRSVVGFGGYYDLLRTLVFMLTGEHEWRGVHYRQEPDPYGGWIVTANYVTAVPEYRGMERLAGAARELAAEAGRRFVYAGESEFDPLKARLRRGLAPEEQRIWDLIAPPTGVSPPAAEARALAEKLVEAALRTHPELDPAPVLAGLRRRVVLAHGRQDHLIPFTETLRLRSHLRQADVSATITRLFAHSREAEGLAPLRYPAEAWKYLRLLDRALR